MFPVRAQTFRMVRGVKPKLTARRQSDKADKIVPTLQDRHQSCIRTHRFNNALRHDVIHVRRQTAIGVDCFGDDAQREQALLGVS